MQTHFVLLIGSQESVFQVETKKVKLPNSHIMKLEKARSKEIALVLPIVDGDKIAVIKQ